MASNFVAPGKNLTLAAPAGGVLIGVGYLIGVIFGVALQTSAAGVNTDFAIQGVWNLAKVAGDTWAVGNRIFWDATQSKATNVPAAGLRLIGKCSKSAANGATTGNVRLNGAFAPLVTERVIGAPVSLATAGDITPLTPAQVLSGLIVRDPNGADRTDTLPTAALLVAAVPGVQVGDTIECRIINGADAAEKITLAAGVGGAFDANQTAASRIIPQNASKSILIRFTNVTGGAEAYVVYA